MVKPRLFSIRDHERYGAHSIGSDFKPPIPFKMRFDICTSIPRRNFGGHDGAPYGKRLISWCELDPTKNSDVISGKYRLGDLIGRGSMGTVYMGEDLETG